MDNTYLDEFQSGLGELIGEMNTILNDVNISKGMRVNKVKELSGRFSDLKTAMHDRYLNEELRRENCGIVSLDLLTSKGNVRYQLTGFENDFVIKQAELLKGDEHVSGFIINYGLTSEMDTDEFIGIDILDAVQFAFVNCVQSGYITMETLEEKLKNSSLLERIKKGLSENV